MATGGRHGSRNRSLRVQPLNLIRKQREQTRKGEESFNFRSPPPVTHFINKAVLPNHPQTVLTGEQAFKHLSLQGTLSCKQLQSLHGLLGQHTQFLCENEGPTSL